MIRVKSRDFLLMICGLLLLVIALVTVIGNVIVDAREISDVERERDVAKNIKSASINVRVTGKGNFVEKGPKYKDLVISDYNVKLLHNGDSVKYELLLCNDDNEDVLVQGISMENVICSDQNGNEKSCDKVKINKSVYIDNQEVVGVLSLKRNSCASVIIETKYEKTFLEREIIVHIDQFILNIKAI